MASVFWKGHVGAACADEGVGQGDLAADGARFGTGVAAIGDGRPCGERVRARFSRRRLQE